MSVSLTGAIRQEYNYLDGGDFDRIDHIMVKCINNVIRKRYPQAIVTSMV